MFTMFLSISHKKEKTTPTVKLFKHIVLKANTTENRTKE
jgi:hypothetical protein